MHNVKRIVRVALLSALLFVVQVALSSLPNIELVSFLLLILTLSLPVTDVLFICLVFTSLEALCWGISNWVVSYLIVWPVLVLVVFLLKKYLNNGGFIAIVLGLFGLCFGSLCSIIIVVLYGFNAGISYLISGLLFDAIHAVSNFLIGLILFKPGMRLVTYIKSQSKV